MKKLVLTLGLSLMASSVMAENNLRAYHGTSKEITTTGVESIVTSTPWFDIIVGGGFIDRERKPDDAAMSLGAERDLLDLDSVVGRLQAKVNAGINFSVARFDNSGNSGFFGGAGFEYTIPKIRFIPQVGMGIAGRYNYTVFDPENFLELRAYIALPTQ